MFPITPVFNSSLQYSHNQSISHISEPQDQGTIILSLSTPQPAIYDRAPHTTHTYTPSKHLNSNESPTKIVDDIQAHDFSIDHRSAPWLVTTPIIDLGLDSLVDISCMQGHTSTKHLHLYTSRHYQARLSEGSAHRERNETTHASPRTVNLTRTNKRSIAYGGEFKVKVR